MQRPVSAAARASAMAASVTPATADVRSIARSRATLRPPIVTGDEGKLFAGAMSPDGRLEQDARVNGVFTKALVERLTGKALHARRRRHDRRTPHVARADRVKQLTKNQQTPTTKPSTVRDFPVVVMK